MNLIINDYDLKKKRNETKPFMNKACKTLILRSQIKAPVRAEGNMCWLEVFRVIIVCTEFMEEWAKIWEFVHQSRI